MHPVKSRHMHVLAAAGLVLMLASCGGVERANTCYGTIRAPGGKGPRAMAVVPCPPGQQSQAERPPGGPDPATLG